MEDRKEPTSEAVERPWASNDKLTYDVALTHMKRVDVMAELAIQQVINHREELHKQKMEHENALFQQKLENNRYTLDRLYSVFPEEAAGLATLLKAVANELGYDLVKKE